MTQFIEVKTTTAKKEDAEKIANSLLIRKLAGCIQISGPISSTYPWKGKTQSSEEWVCIIKTRADLFKAVENLIKEIHPYEVPEIIATQITHGNNEYLDWLSDNLRK